MIRSMKRRITAALAALAVAALAGGGILYFKHLSPVEATVPVPEAAVPIVASTVNAKDVPIYLRGIGTVAAWRGGAPPAQLRGRRPATYGPRAQVRPG